MLNNVFDVSIAHCIFYPLFLPKSKCFLSFEFLSKNVMIKHIYLHQTENYWVKLQFFTYPVTEICKFETEINYLLRRTLVLNCNYSNSYFSAVIIITLDCSTMQYKENNLIEKKVPVALDCMFLLLCQTLLTSIFLQHLI